MKIRTYDSISKQTTYRDMTAAELAELEKQQSEAPVPTPTIEERVGKVEEDTKVIRAILMGEEASE